MKQLKNNKIKHKIHLQPQSQYHHHHHRHPLQRPHSPKPQYPDRRLHGRSRGKHMLKPNVTGIKAILPGNFCDILRIRELNIHALHHTLAALQPNQPNQTRKTYIIQSSPMLRRLNQLDCRMIANLHIHIGRQRHLRETNRARIRLVGRARDGKRLHHGMAHVGRHRAQAHVDVDKGG